MKHVGVFRRLLLVLSILVFGACEPAPMVMHVPEKPVVLMMVPVCGKPTVLTAAQSMWAYSETMHLVPSTDVVAFGHAAKHQGRFYVYDPQADPSNALTMPLGTETTRCPDSGKRSALVKPSKVHLIAGKIVPIPPPPCKLLTNQQALALFDSVSNELRAELGAAQRNAPDAARFVAQPAHAGAMRARVPKVPDPVRLAQEQARQKVITESSDIGKRFGSAVGGIESGLSTLNTFCSRFEEDLRENPHILADIQQKIAKTLNDIPLPPEQTDPELKATAEVAFSRGFEEGFGHKKLQFLALNVTATVAILVFPNVYLAAETAAAKAVRLALERVRSIPIYVPVMTEGAGFFMKFPKARPANLNAPAVPAAKPAPAIAPPAAPAPFGNLSRAAEFGVQTQSKLSKAIAGTGLEKHHLIEQRFDVKMHGDPRMKLTIAVTPAEHQEFTNKWRNEIGYAAKGTDIADRARIIEAAREVYKGYPAILKALDL